MGSDFYVIFTKILLMLEVVGVIILFFILLGQERLNVTLKEVRDVLEEINEDEIPEDGI